MSISIIFPDEAGKRDLYSYCYVEKTLPDHRKLKKKVLIENLIPALRGNMESTFFYNKLGMLPKNFLDAEIATFEPLTAHIYLYIPEGIRRITYEQTVYEIPLPNMIMLLSVTDEKVTETEVFCILKDMTYEKVKKAICTDQSMKYFTYPLGNVSDSGDVCWGSNQLPDIKKLQDVEIIPSLFFDAPTNSDFYSEERTKLHCENIRSLYDKLSGKKEFPYEILTNLE